MNIDDIKWLCEKANYETDNIKDGEEENIYYTNTEETLLKAMFNLRRNDFWSFNFDDHTNSLIVSTGYGEGHMVNYFDFEDDDIKALETALLWIKGKC